MLLPHGVWLIEPIAGLIDRQLALGIVDSMWPYHMRLAQTCVTLRILMFICLAIIILLRGHP